MPTERELAVLKILWRRQSATVREICDALEADGVELAYTTVLTFMQIMERKGLVGHKSAGKAYAYFPKLQRDRTFQKLAGRFLDTVFAGAMDEYVLHALESRRLSVEALERLEKMLAEAKDHSKRKRKKKGEERMNSWTSVVALRIADYYLLAAWLLLLAWVNVVRSTAGTSPDDCLGDYGRPGLLGRHLQFADVAQSPRYFSSSGRPPCRFSDTGS